MKLFEFKPKLVSCLKNYSKETFMADLMAGIIVGLVGSEMCIRDSCCTSIGYRLRYRLGSIARKRYYHRYHRRIYHLPNGR